MAFPTIPTVAAGRVLSTNISGTGTRTFPSLSSLTKNSGDLLIAIIVAYQSSSGAGAPGGSVFSAWGAGFTEFCDQMTTNSSTMAIGMAYKWSTGSETGTFTVTQAATITGDASLYLLSIPGAHLTTPPEVGTIANGTTAAADPASFSPSWGALDTLWIAVAASGMTSGTGSWTGTGTTAPTNYTNRDDSNTTDNSVVGQTEAAVAFRQLNAASENVGTAGVDTSNARNSAIVIAVKPDQSASGSGGVAIAKPTLSGSGTETISGSGSATIPKPTLDGAGAETFTGTGAATISKPTLSGTGTYTDPPSGATGSGGVAIAVPALSGSGAETFTGTGSATIAKPTLAGTGTETMSGSGSATISKPTLAGGGTESMSGSGSATIAKPTLAGSGAETFTGSGSATIAKPTLSGGGTHTIPPVDGSGGAAILAPSLSGSGSVVSSVTGSGSVTLRGPALAGSGSGGVVVAEESVRETSGAGPRRGRATPYEDYTLAMDDEAATLLLLGAV